MSRKMQKKVVFQKKEAAKAAAPGKTVNYFSSAKYLMVRTI